MLKFWQMLHEHQRFIFGTALRLAVMACPQSSGKSTAALLWLINLALNWQGEFYGIYWFVSPTYQESKDKYERTTSYFNRHGVPYRGNKADFTIYIYNGASIAFKSADNPNGLYGRTINALVLDESSRISEDGYLAAMSRLTVTGGPARFLGNRSGLNWFVEFCDNPANSAIVTKYKASQAVQDGLMSLDDYEFWQSQYSALAFAELYELEDCAGQSPFAAGLQANAEAAEPTDMTAVTYGLDLAKMRDFTVLIGLNAAGQVVCHERWQRVDYIDIVQRVTDIVGNAPVYADATGVGAPVIEQIAKNKVKVTSVVITNSPSKVERNSIGRTNLLDRLATALEAGVTSCTQQQIIDELRSFRIVAKANGARYEVPENYTDDSVFAYALAWHGVAMRKQAPRIRGWI